MNWAWLIAEGLIEGKLEYYEGTPSATDVNHAIETAYLATTDDEQRKKLVDMAWASGKSMGGRKEYWYTARPKEAQDFAAAYSGIRVGDGAAPGGEVGNGSKLILPGEPQLWYNTTTDEWYVTYTTPSLTLPDGTEYDGTTVSWLVESDEDLSAVVGPGVTAKAHFTGSSADFTALGVVNLGGVDEMREFESIEGDPFDTWVEDMTILAQTRPWILDDDYVALAVQAAMERADGAVSLDELKTTKWWKEHTVAQRSWMETIHGDPTTAEQMLQDNRNNLRTQLREAGINNPSDALIQFLADKTTTGTWSLSQLQGQISALSDPYSVDKLNDEVIDWMATNNEAALDTTQGKEGVVRDLLQEWLGPVYGAWSEEDIAKKAGELRNDPDGELNFIESLKDQRLAVYGNYSDRNTSYAAAARPWKTFLAGQWGFVPEDTDDVFQQIVQANDPSAAGQLARRTGFERGYEKIVNETAEGINTGSHSNVIGAT
jgi:hypothetical protein